MNRTTIGLLSATFGACVAWAWSVPVHKTTIQTFLTSTTSNYFERMSNEGLTGIASYKDCRLGPPDEDDANMGVAMFGLCTTKSDTSVFYYSLAMSPSAGFVYSSFDRVAKP
jgi:hypothetical protein